MGTTIIDHSGDVTPTVVAPNRRGRSKMFLVMVVARCFWLWSQQDVFGYGRSKMFLVMFLVSKRDNVNNNVLYPVELSTVEWCAERSLAIQPQPQPQPGESTATKE